MNFVYNDAVVTDYGKALRNAAIYEGKTLTFTRAKIGAGEYEDKSTETLEKMTDLKDARNEYALSSITADGEIEKIKLVITNFDGNRSIVDVGYYANEIGLYAKGPNGEEKLYMIMVCAGEKGDYISPYNGKNPLQVLMTINAIFSNTDNITCEWQGAWALAEDLQAEKENRTEADEELTNRLNLISLASTEEVNELVEELMAELPPSPTPGEEIATDEEVEEAIENLDDL